LEALLPESEATAKANKDKSIEKGFQFKYHTHLYHTKTEKLIFTVMNMVICCRKIIGI